MGKGKVGAVVARAATKGSLHLLAEWHGEWRAVVAAMAASSANERMACLLGKRKLAGSISQRIEGNRKNCRFQKEKRT